MALERVLLIRHAEKPVVGGPDGVDIDGNPDVESLIPRGWQRAGALVRYFCPDQPTAGRSSPSTIFAAGVGPGSKSQRSIQTVTPLTQFLGLQIRSDNLKDDYAAMVTKVQQCDGTVLVAWEHKLLPAILQLFLGQAAQAHTWADDCFDRVWELQPSQGGWLFSELNQSLLSGDAA